MDRIQCGSAARQVSFDKEILLEREGEGCAVAEGGRDGQAPTYNTTLVARVGPSRAKPLPLLPLV